MDKKYEIGSNWVENKKLPQKMKKVRKFLIRSKKGQIGTKILNWLKN